VRIKQIERYQGRISVHIRPVKKERVEEIIQAYEGTVEVFECSYYKVTSSFYIAPRCGRETVRLG
jgi:hypothetical protein